MGKVPLQKDMYLADASPGFLVAFLEIPEILMMKPLEQVDPTHEAGRAALGYAQSLQHNAVDVRSYKKLQEYLAHKKSRPLPRTTTGP